MTERVETQWCTRCGARFSESEIESVRACPKCGSSGVPCSVSQDTRIEINWHELRILGIWASNFADTLEEDSKKTLRGILFRLERQHPEWPALSLSGELAQVRKAGYQIESNVPGIKPVEVNGPGAVGHSKGQTS